MTHKSKDQLNRWIIGIATTIALALLTIQVTVMISMNNSLIAFVKDNAKDHNDMNSDVKAVDDFTKYVYEYEIKYNTAFRKKYDGKIKID